MNNSEDSRLITLVLQGDTNAYASLIQRHQDMVFTIARRLLKNNEDAEEMTQDTFIKAYQKLHTFEGKAAFSTWLYSIVYHNCISKLRKKKVTP